MNENETQLIKMHELQIEAIKRDHPGIYHALQDKISELLQEHPFID